MFPVYVNFTLLMSFLSVSISIWLAEKQGIICISTKYWGSYDVYSYIVWLVVRQLSISRRPGVY